jgi:hypothetical protein
MNSKVQPDDDLFISSKSTSIVSIRFNLHNLQIILLGDILNTDSYAKTHGHNPELSTSGTSYNRKRLNFLLFISFSYLAIFDIGFCFCLLVIADCVAQAPFLNMSPFWFVILSVVYFAISVLPIHVFLLSLVLSREKTAFCSSLLQFPIQQFCLARNTR